MCFYSLKFCEVILVTLPLDKTPVTCIDVCCLTLGSNLITCLVVLEEVRRNCCLGYPLKLVFPIRKWQKITRINRQIRNCTLYFILCDKS